MRTAAAVFPTAVGPAITTSAGDAATVKLRKSHPKRSAGVSRASQNSLSCGGRFPMIKYTQHYLTRIEDLLAESDYTLRYEKGNFRSGYCILKEARIIVVNKFYTTEGKINTLLDILKQVRLDSSRFSEKNMKLFEELTQTEVKL
jgi:hypothetical protein